jgi:hypothetical protein
VPNCRVYPPEYVEKAGCDVDSGSVVSVAFIDEGVDFIDISDPAEWIGQNIIILPEVRGLYNKFASTEVEGKGKQATRTSGRKHAIIFKVEAVKSNEAFWNILNKATNYKLAFVTGQDYDTLFYTEKNISTDAGHVIERNLDSIIQWEVSAKWSDLNVPLTSEVPPGIFDGSFESVIGQDGFPYVFPITL